MESVRAEMSQIESNPEVIIGLEIGSKQSYVAEARLTAQWCGILARLHEEMWKHTPLPRTSWVNQLSVAAA